MEECQLDPDMEPLRCLPLSQVEQLDLDLVQEP